jgi:hypothetical protein
MSAAHLTRRQFLLGQYGDSNFSSQNDAGFLSLRFAPAAGSKWSVVNKELRVERSGQKLVCSKRVTDIEYFCSRMMDGSKSLENIITEMSHYLHQDKLTIQKVALDFTGWALENKIIQVESTHD